MKQRAKKIRYINSFRDKQIDRQNLTKNEQDQQIYRIKPNKHLHKVNCNSITDTFYQKKREKKTKLPPISKKEKPKSIFNMRSLYSNFKSNTISLVCTYLN